MEMEYELPPTVKMVIKIIEEIMQNEKITDKELAIKLAVMAYLG
jgi:predicted HTH domain antitoxin